MTVAKIGNKTVGDGSPVFISSEAGATHTGLESAKRLCRASAEAGADAVKFQTMRADDLLLDDEIQIEYQTFEGKRNKYLLYWYLHSSLV